MEFTNMEHDYIQWQKGGCKTRGFNSALYSAIHIADWGNREKLRTVFPEAVTVVESWITGDLAERAGLV